MADDRKLPSTASRAEVDAFLRKVALTPSDTASGEPGRLIFAMDATASREPTWDRASHIQAEMFKETTSLGGLQVQLVYYRGFREFDAAPWVSDANQMLRRMTRVFCLAGHTQIARVLRHAIKETQEKKVNALVFVGDCLEETWTVSVTWPVSSDFWGSRASCSTRGTTTWPPAHSNRSPVFRAAHSAGLTPTRPVSSRSFCRPSRSSRPAAAGL